MKEAYAGVYGDLYRRHWWWRAREEVLLAEIARRSPAGGWGRILDVGCGDALFFSELSRFGDVWGVEADPTLVRDDGPYRQRIHVGRFDASFQPERPFGLVLMLDVLEHLQDSRDALRRAGRMLDKSGALLVTVPAFPVLWTGHDQLNEHVVRYTRWSFEAAARDAGLVPLASRYLFHWLFPAKLAVRMLEAVTGSSPRPASVPPEWLNRTLIGVCRMEEQLLRRARLPFGSSLLAWCLPATGDHASQGASAKTHHAMRQAI